MNYTSSFAEIQLCFSRSRDPIYVTPGRGTCGTSRGISGTTRCIYRDGPRSFWRATRCKNERDIADQAARDRRNGFSSLERPQRRQGQTPSLNKTKRKACVPPRWRWSRCAAPRGLPYHHHQRGPINHYPRRPAFTCDPWKSHEHETAKSSVTVARERISVESMVSEGCDEVGGAPVYIRMRLMLC